MDGLFIDGDEEVGMISTSMQEKDESFATENNNTRLYIRVPYHTGRKEESKEEGINE